MIERFRFPNDVTFVVDHEARICWTKFGDGTSVPATGNLDAESIQRAAELGYRNTWEMSRDHEMCHNLLAAVVGLPYSPVLWSVAHPDEPKPPKFAMHEEECQVFTIQRALVKAASALEAVI